MEGQVSRPEGQSSDAADGELADATAQLGLAASSRFEFETSKGNEGTKILMVEWDTSQATAQPDEPPGVKEGSRNDTVATGEAAAGESTSRSNTGGDWKVSWEGKAATFPTRDRDAGTRKRVYFLLPPGVHVPRVVTITHASGTKLTTKPLPAIFPEGLASETGTRGVLHTIWAKKRLAEVEDEIAKELHGDAETLGLELVLKEKGWLLQHFGLGGHEHLAASALSPVQLPGPLSPRSPVAGRLGEKLKGLKLATSPSELTAAAAAAAKNRAAFSNTDVRSLSPRSADLAIPSYSAIHQQDIPSGGRAPNPIAAALEGSNGDAKADDGENEDDLFALPMSPRSPEMKRSPFSLL